MEMMSLCVISCAVLLLELATESELLETSAEVGHRESATSEEGTPWLKYL